MKIRRGCSAMVRGANVRAVEARLLEVCCQTRTPVTDESPDLFAGRYAVVDHASDVGVCWLRNCAASASRSVLNCLIADD